MTTDCFDSNWEMDVLLCLLAHKWISVITDAFNLRSKENTKTNIKTQLIYTSFLRIQQEDLRP